MVEGEEGGGAPPDDSHALICVTQNLRGWARTMQKRYENTQTDSPLTHWLVPTMCKLQAFLKMAQSNMVNIIALQETKHVASDCTLMAKFIQAKQAVFLAYQDKPQVLTFSRGHLTQTSSQDNITLKKIRYDIKQKQSDTIVMNRKAGVAVLMHTPAGWQVDLSMPLFFDNYGRTLGFTCNHPSEGQLQIVTVHLHSDPTDRTAQLIALQRKIKTWTRTMVLGDFNSVISQSQDTTNPEASVTMGLQNEMARDEELKWMKACNIIDVYRNMFPVGKDVSRLHLQEGQIPSARRIDRILLSADLVDYVSTIEHLDWAISDHKLVKMHVKLPQRFPKQVKKPARMWIQSWTKQTWKDFRQAINATSWQTKTPQIQLSVWIMAMKAFYKQQRQTHRNVDNPHWTKLVMLQKFQEKAIASAQQEDTLAQWGENHKSLELFQGTTTPQDMLKALDQKIKNVKQEAWGQELAIRAETHIQNCLEKTMPCYQATAQLKNWVNRTLGKPMVPIDINAAADFQQQIFQAPRQITARAERLRQKALANIPKINIPGLTEFFTSEECTPFIQRAKKGKASGRTPIPNEMWTHALPESAELLSSYLNAAAWQEMSIKCLLRGETSMIHKEGPTDNYGNFRPITVMDTFYRLMADVTQGRMIAFYPEMFTKQQSGFLKGRSIYLNILYLKCTFDIARTCGRTIYVLFIDLRKAFDKCDRQTIYLVLQAMGMPKAWINWIKKLAEDIVSRIVQGEKVSKNFSLFSGVLQGGPLSPWMFNLLVELLVLEINELAKHWDTIILIPTVWFADDGSIMAESVEYLQLIMELVDQWTSYTNQDVNIVKSKIIIVNFLANHAIPTTLVLANQSYEVLPVHSPQRYLGVGLSGQMQEGVEYVFAKQKWDKKMAKWQRLPTNFTIKAHMLAVEVVPAVFHAMTVAPLPENMLKQMEVDIKKILGGSVSPQGRIHYNHISISKLETGWPSGGTTMPNLSRRAKSLLGKGWIQICDYMEQEWQDVPFWIGCSKPEIEAFLDQNRILISQCRFLHFINDAQHLPVWQTMLKAYAQMNTRTQSIKNMFEFEHLPLNFSQHFLYGVKSQSTNFLSIPPKREMGIWTIQDVVTRGAQVWPTGQTSIVFYWKKIPGQWKLKVKQAITNFLNRHYVKRTVEAGRLGGITVTMPDFRSKIMQPYIHKPYLGKAPGKAAHLYKKIQDKYKNPKWPEEYEISARCWKVLQVAPFNRRLKDWVYRYLHTSLPVLGRVAPHGPPFCIWCGPLCLEFESHAHMYTTCKLNQFAKKWADIMSGGQLTWKQLHLSSERYANKKIENFEELEWWPLLVFWVIKFELWKYRSSWVSPKSKSPLPIPKVIFFIMATLEHYKKWLENQTQVSHPIWTEVSLSKEWDWQAVELKGKDINEKIRDYLNFSKTHFLMFQPEQFQSEIYEFMAQFQKHLQLWTNFAGITPKATYLHEKQLATDKREPEGTVCSQTMSLNQDM